MTEAQRPRLVAGVASALFVLSGFAGLTYEVVWFKHFSHLWGNSSIALASVVSAFLAGLGAGALLIGRFVDKVRNPLRAYALIEVAIGACALLVLKETALLHSLVGSLAGAEQPALVRYLLQFLATSIAIAPPCILMGTTLPLFVRAFSTSMAFGGERASTSRTTAWLYALNTLGAALGCATAGFVLLPALGLWGTSLVAVAVNVAIGACAFLLARGAPAPLPAAVEPTGAAGAPRKHPRARFRANAVALFLAGGAALLLQVAWTRQLAVTLGGSTYAFTSMLVVILVGIGAGSLVFHRFLTGVRTESMIVVLVLVLATSTFLGKESLPFLAHATGMLRTYRTSLVGNVLVCVGASAVLELVPALVMGVLFPAFVHLLARAVPAAGRCVAISYGANTFGTLIGALLAALWLLPSLGTGATLAIGIALYVIAALLVLPLREEGGAVLATAAGVGGFLLVAAVPSLPDPRRTDMGFFMYGNFPVADQEVLFFDEGISCNVLVTEDSQVRALRLNGKVDAGTGDASTQLALGYLPQLMRPSAKDVLVIGYGTGMTVGASLLFPGVDVTCCEIEPAVVAAGELFTDVNHSPLESPDLTMVFDDGRSFLEGTDERFDIVISEPSNPWIAGIANLFTDEFYATVRERLTPGGLLVQWIQSYSLSAEDYAMVVRTVRRRFEHCGLFVVHSGSAGSIHDTILFASDEPIVPDAATAAVSQALIDANSMVRADLALYLGSDRFPSLLARHFLLDTAGIQRLADAFDDQRIHTDDRMDLEFSAPLDLFGQLYGASGPLRHILAAVQPDPLPGCFETVGATVADLPALQERVELLAESQHPAALLELVESGLALDPEAPFFVAHEALLSHPPDGAELERLVDRVAARSPREAHRLGESFRARGDAGRARAVFERLTALLPASATTWASLGSALEDLGRTTDAAAARARALQLDPLNPRAITP
ncbi:MAG: fused MFS/spermidine synthase [Planctomycetota bacterium]|nr:fused MFS/spermidine synthase [Planctomycetota bacterium]